MHMHIVPVGSGLLLAFRRALDESVSALTLEAYEGAGSRYLRWYHSVRPEAWKVKEGQAHYLSFGCCLCYVAVVYLFSKGKGNSAAAQFLGWANMRRLANDTNG